MPVAFTTVTCMHCMISSIAYICTIILWCIHMYTILLTPVHYNVTVHMKVKNSTRLNGIHIMTSVDIHIQEFFTYKMADMQFSGWRTLPRNCLQYKIINHQPLAYYWHVDSVYMLRYNVHVHCGMSYRYKYRYTNRF